MSSKTIKLSLCMIVKNEEEVLARCLESVKNEVDEIIIADTGSDDATREIARRYTEKIFSFPWTEDFSAARNFSFSKATGDYILWLDADDVILSEAAAKLTRLKMRLAKETPDTVMCRYVISFDDAGAPIYSYYRERILRREAKPLWQGCVHECIAPSGNIIYSDFFVCHKKPQSRFSTAVSGRNLNIYRKNIARGYFLNARDKFYYGRELFYNKLYTEAAALLTEATDAPEGWYVNKIEACLILSDCYLAQNKTQQALSALFKSFLFGEPRASVLCAIGKIFKNAQKYPQAIFWYNAALQCGNHEKEGDFEMSSMRGIVPLIELTYCHYQNGDTVSALKYHILAKAENSNHPSVVYNEAFFQSLKSDKKPE